jgi:hypothetical protein
LVLAYPDDQNGAITNVSRFVAKLIFISSAEIPFLQILEPTGYKSKLNLPEKLSKNIPGGMD